jgi:hypothetical protein
MISFPNKMLRQVYEDDRGLGAVQNCTRAQKELESVSNHHA